MNNFIELKDFPTYENLLDELNTIVDLTDNQYCITAPAGYEDDIFYGVGSLKYDWPNANTDENGKVHVPLRETPPTESDFTQICNQFKNTQFENIYNLLNKKYILGRVRIMTMHPSTCLTWHQDTEERIHYPIKTQEGCFMVIEDEVKHLEQDKWYYTKTLKKHTTFNGSKERRIHLVANILGVR